MSKAMVIMTAAAAMAAGVPDGMYIPWVENTGPIFIPRKHTVMGYAW